MENPLLEVQQELRARKCKTVRQIFWSPDVEEFTIIPKDPEVKSFNLKPKDRDAKECADYIEGWFKEDGDDLEKRSELKFLESFFC